MSDYHVPKKPAEWMLQSYRENLAYDETVRGLVWKTDRANGAIKAGTKAGSVTNKGAITIGLQDKDLGSQHHSAHHIVWFLITGEWPTRQLDHIDTDPTNNLFENLRLSTTAQNAMNRGAIVLNPLGQKNIRYREKYRSYVVTIIRGGRRVVEKSCRSLDDAIKARDAWYHENGCEFSRT